MTAPVHLVLSVDTEEDNWLSTCHDVTVENIRELPRFHSFLRGLGLRPTYFVDYPVAATPWAVTLLREIQADGGAEIGAHLHPWNTPPVDEKAEPRSTMLRNLPSALQRAKIVNLRDVLGEALGAAPTSFRAGRMGLGVETVDSLIQAGFRVDSSVTPFINWGDYDDGPNFVGAPVACYRLDGRGDVRVPVPDGPLCEVPVSCGFTKRPFSWRGRAHSILTSRFFRSLRLAGVASRIGLVRRVMGSPEVYPIEDLLALSRCLLGEGVPFVHLLVHSSSLVPGLSPFVTSVVDRERLYTTIERYVEGLAKMASIRPATVSEAAEALCFMTGSEAGQSACDAAVSPRRA